MPETSINTDALDKLVAKMESLTGEQGKQIERKALKAVNAVVLPALLANTPVSAGYDVTLSPRKRGSRGSTSQPVGALRESIRARVFAEKDGQPAEAIVDFGKLNYIANFVDGGTSKAPAHPFIRNTEDAVAAEATEAYVSTLDEEVTKVMNGQ